METPHEQFEVPKEGSVLNEPDIKAVLERRQIAAEDYPLIEQLAGCPKDLFLEFHNFFSSNRERILPELKNQLELTKAGDAARRKFLDAYIALAEKYDWTACWNINVAFERRGNN